MKAHNYMMPITEIIQFTNSQWELKVCNVNGHTYGHVGDINKIGGVKLQKFMDGALAGHMVNVSTYGSKKFKKFVELNVFCEKLESGFEFPNKFAFIKWIQEFVIPNARKEKENKNNTAVWMENAIANFEKRMVDQINSRITRFFTHPEEFVYEKEDIPKIFDTIAQERAAEVMGAAEEKLRKLNLEMKGVVNHNMNLITARASSRYYTLNELRKLYNRLNVGRISPYDFSSMLCGLGVIYPKRGDLHKYGVCEFIPPQWVVNVSNGSSYSLKYGDALLEALMQFRTEGRSPDMLIYYGNMQKEIVWGI